MVERQLRRRGIADERVLGAMGSVPREAFVPEDVRRRAYADSALPIGHGQTISQPWVVAAICQALELEGDESVLEIGTGSGYSAAVLAQLADERYQLRAGPGAGRWRPGGRWRELGVENVEVILGDGSRGHEQAAPYDAIAVHAATPEAPHSLIAQLARRRAAGGPDRRGLGRPADGLPPRRRARLRIAAGDDRALPLRAADRRRGFHPE